MTARVNLLPGTVRERDAATRQRVVAGAVVVVVIAALAVATLLQRGVLQDAEEELADAEAELADAQAEVAELALYEDLEQRTADADVILSAAMGDEATLAGLLQDIALVTPPEGALRTLSISFEPDASGVGSFNAQMEVLDSHAPGAERFLLQLERAVGFRNVFPGASILDENDIATFPVTVQLGHEYRTERYDDGLPEVLR